MLRFPKRARAKSIDLEDGDLVELVDTHLADPDDLVDTRVLPPKETGADTPGSSLLPVAMSARAATSKIPRVEPTKDERAGKLPFYMVGRPSLPWAGILVALGAIAATVSARVLDALDGQHADVGKVAAAQAPPPMMAVAAPLTPPAPRKAAPVVLTFAPSDAVTVAVDPPKPAPAPQAAAAPAPPAAVLPVLAPAGAPAGPAAAQKPIAAAPAAPKPAPSQAASADAVKKATTIDSLAEQQLKAALK